MSENDSLPQGWAVASLGAVVEPRIGKADPQGYPTAKFIGMEQVEAHTMRLLGTVSAGTMKSGANTFQPGDVLYGRLRSYLNKVYQPDFAGLCSGEFIVLPETSAVYGKFLKYRLNASDFVRFASQINTGDRPRVDFDQIGTFRLNLPPRNEQERITDALDELLSDLDAGVKVLEQVRAKLSIYRATVLKAAFEGTLTADRREQHPQSESAVELLEQILAERRKRWEDEQLCKFEKGREPPKNWKEKYKEPAVTDTSGLPLLPDGWCWTNLDALTVEGPQNGLYLPSTLYGQGVEILRIDDFQNGWTRPREELKRVEASADAIATYALRLRDLVINRVNSMTHLGKCCLIADTFKGVLFESNMMRLEIAEATNAKYIERYLHSETGRRRLTKNAKWAVNQASINQEDVKRTAVPLPSLDEQDAIVESVEDHISIIDHLESDLEAKLTSSQALRQSILRHAFAGKLVSQDPRDEPAGELLMRIAAEREQRARDAEAAKCLNRQTRRASPGSRKPHLNISREASNGRVADR